MESGALVGFIAQSDQAGVVDHVESVHASTFNRGRL